MTAKLLKPNGSEDISPLNGKNFTLEECYKLIGCETIEIAKTSEKGMILIIDEEGKLKPNPIINHVATGYYLYGGQDKIVGNAMLIPKKMFR